MGGASTILVVDDNAGNRALARATLEDEGYRVVVAADGEEAVAQAEASRPDCVLLDVHMPGVDGIAACRRIRTLPGGGDIAIVFLTAQRDVATFDRALAAGGDDFLTKPFRTDELVMRVQTALRLRRIANERTELYEQLKQQRDRLLRLELVKEQLAAFLVHDLKNPVNAIELHAQTIERRAEDVERSRRSAGQIRDEARSLLRMIMNLLDVSKADEGLLAPALTAIDAAELVDRVAAELGARAAASGVRIATSIQVPQVRAARALIARVLANLIDNAIRHAPEGSEVRVELAASDGGVELRVADAGPGVPQDARDAVFDRFQTGAPAGHANRGLGLAFCKLAVEAHGGRIWIEDAAPGAVFCARW